MVIGCPHMAIVVNFIDTMRNIYMEWLTSHKHIDLTNTK